MNEITEKMTLGQVVTLPELEAYKNSIKFDGDNLDLNPEKIDKNKPYILLCSGGAYICVCHHVEALPTAEHFVDAGYQVYRSRQL